MSRLPHVDNEKPTSVMNVNTKLDDIFQFVNQTNLEKRIIETSLFNDSINENPFHNDIVRCYALYAQENSFGIRVNTTISFCAANQKIFSLWNDIFIDSVSLPLVSPQSNVKSTQITECAVSDHATIAERTSLKNCVIGSNCTVNIKSRIANSVLMNGVTIEEG